MSAAGQLRIWTVYDHPTDFPNNFVARAFDGLQPTEEIVVGPTLAGVRQILAMKGLVRLERMPGDDPKIVETWL